MSRKDEAIQLDTDRQGASQELRAAVESMHKSINETEPEDLPKVWTAWVRLIKALTHHLDMSARFAQFMIDNIKDE